MRLLKSIIYSIFVFIFILCISRLYRFYIVKLIFDSVIRYLAATQSINFLFLFLLLNKLVTCLLSTSLDVVSVIRTFSCLDSLPGTVLRRKSFISPGLKLIYFIWLSNGLCCHCLWSYDLLTGYKCVYCIVAVVAIVTGSRCVKVWNFVGEWRCFWSESVRSPDERRQRRRRRRRARTISGLRVRGLPRFVSGSWAFYAVILRQTCNSRRNLRCSRDFQDGVIGVWIGAVGATEI